MHPLTNLDPTPWFDDMRENSPVHFDPEFTFFFGAKGGWQLFSYQDVKQAFSDYESFSSEYIPVSGEDLLGSSMLTSDPPRHKKLRQLVTKAFSPAVILRLEQWLYEQCHQLILPAIQTGEMEFVSSFAAPLPNLVLARLIGIPEENNQQVSKWSKALTGDPTVIGMDIYYNTMNEMSAFLMQLLEERAQNPREDLITDLLQAEIEGEKLTPMEILAFCITLLGAGTETTESWLMIALHIFTQYPDIQRYLTENPQEIPKALNEVLRFRSPVLGMPRIAKRDMELSGKMIKKGDFVNLCIAAANLDPAVFPDPGSFEIHRDNSRVISFGHGIHHCIGSVLAKLETRVAFEVIFKHMSNIRIKPGATLTRTPSSLVYSYKELPVVFNS